MKQRRSRKSPVSIVDRHSQHSGTQNLNAAQQRAHIFSEFEMSLATQLARINARLAQSTHRVFRANAQRRATGPYIAQGDSALAYGGDTTDVEIKK